jgi:hypothetical protein
VRIRTTPALIIQTWKVILLCQLAFSACIILVLRHFIHINSSVSDGQGTLAQETTMISLADEFASGRNFPSTVTDKDCDSSTHSAALFPIHYELCSPS